MAQRKNAQGAGTIRKRTDGRWEARFTIGFDPATGKQVQKSIYGKTQKEVRERLSQVTVELDEGSYIEPSRMTLEQWMEIWLAEYMFDKKWSTVKHYRAQVQTHILPALGCYPLSQLDPHVIQTFYNSLLRGTAGKKTSPKSVRNINGVLRKSLSVALKLGYLRRNPTEQVTLPRVEKKQIKPLTDEQVAQIVAQAGNDGFGTLFKVVVFTGLRLGEALGLTWDCIDFEKGLITVKQQLQRERRSSGEYHLVSPKNGKSRTLSPAPSVMALLKRQQKRQMEMRLKAGPAWTDSSYVFTDELGGNLSAQTVYLHFKKLIAEAGYPNTRFHDLRHTYAVAALHSGDDIKTVQEALGHHTAAFTLDTYAHVTQEMKRESADRMETFIQSVSSQ